MNLISDLISIVSKVAPVLGTALGTPLAGVAISLIAKLFGGDEKSISDIKDKILSTPDYELKLKQLEYEHIETLLKINSTDYATEVDDRKNARDLEVQSKSIVPSIIAISFLVIYSAIQYFVISHPTTQDDIISARVQDIFIMIISYYFGSTHKSSK